MVAGDGHHLRHLITALFLHILDQRLQLFHKGWIGLQSLFKLDDERSLATFILRLRFEIGDSFGGGRPVSLPLTSEASLPTPPSL